ncbi:Neuropeptide Y [Operophtera brumata]|uniref:Neuropeptide Y n=1 Tax=Operophtera brumata TaxID=104452 RepID=A0A0L7K4L2_OPEBR|nr:Neuropeptide Y [Operophtera brumata]
MRLLVSCMLVVAAMCCAAQAQTRARAARSASTPPNRSPTTSRSFRNTTRYMGGGGKLNHASPRLLHAGGSRHVLRGAGSDPRPRRPERFDTAEQISNYLKELQEYYSVHGRGRYGKRQMHIADASVIFRDSPIFEHNLNEDPLFKNLGFK